MYEILAMDAVQFRSSYLKSAMKTVNEYDRAILSRPGFGSAFAEASAECFAQGARVRDPPSCP